MTMTPLPQPTVYIVPTTTPTSVPVTSPAAPTHSPALTSTPYITRTIVSTKTPTAHSKYFSLRAISSAIDAKGQPITPTVEFTAGVRTVYVFFDYKDTPQGALMRQTWFLNGSSVYFDSTTWALSGNGMMHVSWSPKQGFDPGLYEVRVMLGDTRQFSANFMVH